MIILEKITECLQCNQKLDTLHDNQKFCSTKCSGLYKRTRLSKKCQYCGELFECTKSQSTKKYCTRACYFAVKQKNSITKKCNECGELIHCMESKSTKKYCTRACYVAAKSKNNIIKKCRHCGHDFPSSKKSKHVFCSRKCWDEHPRYKSPHNTTRVPKPCKQCGELMFRRQKDSKFCSKECQYESRRIPKIDLICTHCKKNYQVQHHRTDSKFCSKKCQLESNRIPKIDLICTHCKKNYQVQHHRTDSKFCSKKCYTKHSHMQSNEITTNSGHISIRQEDSSKYQARHRVVMEAHLGRDLHEDEIVHHINYNKSDNQIENLDVLSKEEHGFAHGTLRNLVKILLENGEIEFDRKKCVYEIR